MNRYPETFDMRHQFGKVCRLGGREINLDSPVVGRHGDAASEILIDGSRDFRGRAEAGLAQQQRELGKGMQFNRRGPFDQAAARNPAHGRMVYLAKIAGVSRAIAANRKWTLRRGVDLTIGGAERGQEQKPTFEALGIAQR